MNKLPHSLYFSFSLFNKIHPVFFSGLKQQASDVHRLIPTGFIVKRYYENYPRQLRHVISGFERRQPVWGNTYLGMLFLNEKEEECGGLIYNGKKRSCK